LYDETGSRQGIRNKKAREKAELHCWAVVVLLLRVGAARAERSTSKRRPRWRKENNTCPDLVGRRPELARDITTRRLPAPYAVVVRPCDCRLRSAEESVCVNCE
jgi:hypothetical protein